MNPEPLDFSAYTCSTATYFIRLPEYRWQWCFNGDWRGMVVNVERAPNAFYRFIQRHFLGIHWRKIPNP